MEARSHKVARAEAQLLTHAFFDETPEVSVEGRALTASWLHRTQQVFRNALALRQAVHLLNAKALDQQIASMCLTQPDPALSLRTVTTSELLHTDRQIWGTIVDFCVATGPWTMPSMNSRMAAWRSIRSSCCDPKSPKPCLHYLPLNGPN